MRYVYNFLYLKELRHNSGMTIKMLAEKLDMSIRHISRFECGDTPLNHQMIMKYSEIFPNFQIEKLYVCVNDNNDGGEE